MKIAIIGPWNYDILCQEFEIFINKTQCYLFTIICGGLDEKNLRSSIGYQWATANGAPVNFIIKDDVNKLIDTLVKEIDYAFIAYDGEDSIIRNLIMKMKMKGKHGKVVKYE